MCKRYVQSYYMAWIITHAVSSSGLGTGVWDCYLKRGKSKLKQGLSENSTDLTLRTIFNHISLVKIFILLCFLRKNLPDSNKKIEIVPHLLMYLLHLLTQLSSSCLQLSLQHLDFLVLDC